MHVGMSVAAQGEQPRQNDGNRARSINAEEQQAENIKQHRDLKLVGNIVGDLDHSLRPYSVVQRRLLPIYLTCFYCLNLPYPKYYEHCQGQ